VKVSKIIFLKQIGMYLSVLGRKCGEPVSRTEISKLYELFLRLTGYRYVIIYILLRLDGTVWLGRRKCTSKRIS
jgi:hypothetical protein